MHQLLNELYVQAARDLLSDYGLTVDIQERGGGTSARNKSSYVSILIATSEAIRLSSMLKIDQDLVVRMHPTGGGDIAQEYLEDWCGELNNQLVGRVKNKLLGYDHVLIMGLPVLIAGTDISPIRTANSEVHEYSIESAQGQIALNLATLVTRDFKPHELEPTLNGDAVLLGGAVALF